MKPRSTGRVRLRSTRSARGAARRARLPRHPDDLAPLVEGIELARTIGATEPLRELLADELGPERPTRSSTSGDTIRNYFHPAGTCALGAVVDSHGRVFGVEGLFVADASVMPTIPRANTNLTTAAIAERIADGF